jgi:predicted helicase
MGSKRCRTRLTKGENFKHAMITDTPIEVISLSPKTSNNGFLFPIYLYGDNGKRRENISSQFRKLLDEQYQNHYTPEEVLGYIYAILYTPTYRNRYAEFLRKDFPRIPLPRSSDDFETLSKLGWALVQVHLLHELPREKLAIYHGHGAHTIEIVRYSGEEEAISINKTQFFKPIPEEIWNFHIGGYQVLDKYLRSRKGRALSLDEINHVGAIANSLAFTIQQMAKIDIAYKAAFAERG